MNGDYRATPLMKNDPAVKAHVFQAQARPFDVFWVTNKFEPGAEAGAEAQNPVPK